jgi:hypothetical protein
MHSYQNNSKPKAIMVEVERVWYTKVLVWSKS